jgi:hypothetical protein
MGYKTWANEEVLASADVNNLLMKQTVIVCTSGTRPGSPPEGMLIYETDTDTYRGYDGSAWQEIFVLNPPRAEVTRSSTQSIPDSVQTTLVWQTANYNYRAMWNSVTNPSRLTIPAGMGGLYRFNTTVEFDHDPDPQSGTGTRQVALMKNGAIVGRLITANAGTGQAARVFYEREIVAAAGDYFEVAVYQNSGTAIVINVVQTTPFFQARRVGPA